MSDGAQPARPAARAGDVRRLDRSDRRGRSAAGAAAAAGHRAQRRHHAVGLGRPEGVPPRCGRPPTGAIRRVNANGPLYGALELSADYLPVLDPVRHTASQVPLTVRDPNTPRPRGRRCRSRRPTGATRRSGPARTTCTIRCSTTRAGSGSPRRCARPRIPAFCKEGSSHPSAKLFPVARAGRHLAVYDPKTKKLTHIGTCFGTHHLMFAEDANNTLWTSGGGAGGRLAEHEDVRRNRRRGEVAGLDRADPRHQRQRQARRVRRAEPAGRSGQGQADRRRLLRRRAGRRRIGLGILAGLSRARSSGSLPARTRRRRRSPRSTSRRGTIRRVATSGVFAARHGHRPQRRRLGRAGERPPGQLRPAQVQGTAQRTERDGSALPRRMDVLCRAAAADEGRDRQSGSAEASYYTWVDQFDTFGLGRNIPINTGNALRRRCWRSRTGSGSCCASLIRWASSPSGWTAGSTIPTAGWKGRGCGRP